jgi:hypothetical protein
MVIALKWSDQTNDCKKRSGVLLRACKLNRRSAITISFASQFRAPLPFLQSSAFRSNSGFAGKQQKATAKKQTPSHPLRLSAATGKAASAITSECLGRFGQRFYPWQAPQSRALSIPDNADASIPDVPNGVFRPEVGDGGYKSPIAETQTKQGLCV